MAYVETCGTANDRKHHNDMNFYPHCKILRRMPKNTFSCFETHEKHILVSHETHNAQKCLFKNA